MLHFKSWQWSHNYLIKNSQDSISISTTYIPPASTINTALLDNIKKTADNKIIPGDLNAKHIDFNCTKTDKWGLPWKKALYNADLFIADNSNPTTTAKTDMDKLKLFMEQLKSVFATEISVDDHEDFINSNELDRIIKNLDIKKSPGLDSINNK